MPRVEGSRPSFVALYQQQQQYIGLLAAQQHATAAVATEAAAAAAASSAPAASGAGQAHSGAPASGAGASAGLREVDSRVERMVTSVGYGTGPYLRALREEQTRDGVSEVRRGPGPGGRQQQHPAACSPPSPRQAAGITPWPGTPPPPSPVLLLRARCAARDGAAAVQRPHRQDALHPRAPAALRAARLHVLPLLPPAHHPPQDALRPLCGTAQSLWGAGSRRLVRRLPVGPHG